MCGEDWCMVINFAWCTLKIEKTWGEVESALASGRVVYERDSEIGERA